MQLRITPILLKTDVTAIKYHRKYVWAGIGNKLLVLNLKGDVLYSNYILDKQKIHGIVPSSEDHVILFGADVFKVFKWEILENKVELEEVSSCVCEDWILTSKWLKGNNEILTISAHNIITRWVFNKAKKLEQAVCEERCLIYSALVAYDDWDELVVFSGTAFRELLIWKPVQKNNEVCPVLHRLRGHEGIIFSIAYSDSAGIIASTSDDRTVCVWEIASKTIITELQKPDIQISLKSKIYGHTSRVWACQVVENLVISAGEDSRVYIWDLSGNILNRTECHQGGSVWVLDCNYDDNLIITGGADGAVTVFPMIAVIKEKELSAEEEVPRKVILTAKDSVVAIMDSGLLKYYIDGCCKSVYQHDDMKTYALLEVSKCKTTVGLAGIQGNIHIYVEDDNNLVKTHIITPEKCDRIYSLHFLNSFTFLTCGSEGIMGLHVTDPSASLKPFQFQLPYSKERCSSAASFYMNKYVVIGDRRGNLHLLCCDTKNIVQTMKKAHNHLGVSDLSQDEQYLFSLGRDFKVKRYFLNEENRLMFVSTDQVPFSWLTKMIHKPVPLLIGFSGSNFVIWNYENRCTLFSLNCGGGHRSWDLTCSPTQMHFTYIKEKTVRCCRSNLWNTRRDLVKGYHPKVVNSVIVLSKHKNTVVFMSGSEDTTLRLCYLHDTNFCDIEVIKSHLSSIRCITSCKISENEERYLVFSAGGRSQVILWEVVVQYEESIPKIICKEKDNYYKYSQSDVESRIMDLTTVHLDNSILLVCGCSDGSLKVYSVVMQPAKYKLLLIYVAKYDHRCILKVSNLNIFGRHVIVSMATDGKVVLWDFTEIINIVNTLNPNESNPVFDGLLKLEPFFISCVHQCGINSFDSRPLSSSTWLFVSGGDDNALVAYVLKFAIESGILKVEIVSKWEALELHYTQITGVRTTEKYLLTTAIDQNVFGVRWEFTNNVIHCEPLVHYSSTVPDIQGMCCTEYGNNVLMCVYGKGMELCEVTDSSSAL